MPVVRLRRWRDLPITARGVVLVMLPLLVALGLLAQLHTATQRVEQADHGLHERDEVRARALELHRLLLQAESAVYGHLALHGEMPRLLEAYDAADAEIADMLGDLRLRVAGTEDERRVRVITHQMAERLTLLQRLRATSPERLGRLRLLAAENVPVSDALRYELDQLQRSQAEQAETVEARLAGLRRLRNLLRLGLAVMLLTAIVVAGLFAHRNVRRLDRLTRNTRRLVRDEPLDRMDSSGDEMGRLAVALEETSVLLRERAQGRLAAQREAERANQAKNTFLSRMSHELRTPLTAVLGFAELLEMEDLDESQRDSVRHIRKAGRHLLTLINEVLDISRIEAGALALSIEPVELRSVVDEALSLIRPLAEDRGVRLRWDCPSGLMVRADRQRLMQILLNLLSNAVKYNRDFGEVDVRAAAGGDRVRVTVRDTGHGIPPDFLPRVFAPFDRLGAEQTAVEGTGVGMSLSKGLAETMGGTLTVASEVGTGTTFTLELPTALTAVDGEPHAGAREESGDDVDLETLELTVLYVEDNADNLALVARLLSRHPGIRLITTVQGGLAIELARIHRPDLVLLDLHLPDIPGAQVLRQLRATPEVGDPVVAVVTADATPGQERRLRDLGADAHLTKPIDFNRLYGLLRLSARGREART